ncbi:MAG: hypothetical protein IRZ33_00770 [Alicyclobacillaceae bacterium]|nr:hypothetical protein [Alicyclobacillaceae bacterium]
MRKLVDGTKECQAKDQVRDYAPSRRRHHSPADRLRSVRMARGVLAVLALLALGVPACRRVEAPANPGAAMVDVNRQQASRAAQITKPAGTAKPLTVQPQLEQRIARMPGLKWPVVLQEGNRVYVGVFPQDTGAPPRGEDQRTGFRGPKIWDSRTDLAKQTPDVWIRALEEWYPAADTYDHRPRQRSGTMSPAQQKTIRQVVVGALPGTRSVLITTDIASAAMLHGYAEFVRAGGDMTRYMNEFHRRVNLIWPNGRGIAADRPSASPNFGTLTRPADERTPTRGPVRIP